MDGHRGWHLMLRERLSTAVELARLGYRHVRRVQGLRGISKLPLDTTVWMSSLLHRTPPETKTATFGLRVDYILPSRYVQNSISGTRVTLAAHTHCMHAQLQPHP
jgi:hypothetical protein